MNQFLQGAVVMAFLVVVLFFARFFRQTRDPLFLFFCLSFAVQGASEAALAVMANPTEGRPVFYLPRLAAYLLIALAIVSKNLRRSGRS